MAVTIPEHQAVADFPTSNNYTPAGPQNATLIAARNKWKDHLAMDDWKDGGTKDGVALANKPNPEDPDGVPIVKGVTTIPNATTDQVLGAIVTGGVRKLWDPRLDWAAVLQRFDPSSIQFYTVMRGQMFVSARDFVGVQVVERSHESNKDILITQTSIPDDEHAPPQSGRVRAHAFFGGWLLEPSDSGVKITYITCISLEGSIPTIAMRIIAAEIPIPLPVALDNETSDATSGKWTATLKTLVAGTTAIRYDSKLMYKNGMSISAKVKSGPEDAATVTDDGAGTLTVHVKEAGAFVEISLSPK
ncbi:Bet v1-like protein [Auriculariales sp. MPI-PUGE-AT-0066]|nr:Bet v1-like protein [Auriculariales sp. MPI-PUGE-AT-0066]